MVVVADTSPLNYLILLDRADLLEKLFHQVLVPAAVAHELGAQRSPRQVREWIAKPPAWLEVHDGLYPRLTALEGLDPGEKEAISMALAMDIPLVLIDEKRGRDVAQALSLQVQGTLRILITAAVRGFTNLEDDLLVLQSTTFHLSRQLINIARRLYAAELKDDQ